MKDIARMTARLVQSIVQTLSDSTIVGVLVRTIVVVELSEAFVRNDDVFDRRSGHRIEPLHERSVGDVGFGEFWMPAFLVFVHDPVVVASVLKLGDRRCER